MNQEELRENLSRQIEVTFPKREFEHITLFENPDWQLQGKHWREIPLDFLKREEFIFALPTSESGGFFLPAYIEALLTNPEAMAGYESKLLWVFGVMRKSEWELSGHFADLNKEQKVLILAFLEAYPILFPHLFEVKRYPSEVNELIRELDLTLGLDFSPLQTDYVGMRSSLFGGIWPKANDCQKDPM